MEGLVLVSAGPELKLFYAGPSMNDLVPEFLHDLIVNTDLVDVVRSELLVEDLDGVAVLPRMEHDVVGSSEYARPFLHHSTYWPAHDIS